MSDDWQEIATAKAGMRIDALCVDEFGIEVCFPDVLFVDDEVPYAFVIANPIRVTAYRPHENGMWLKSWRPSPPREGGR